jgi:hypothetical protein
MPKLSSVRALWLMHLLCLVLAGCIPNFDNPVADKEHCDADDRLAGEWTDGSRDWCKVEVGKNGIYRQVDTDGSSLEFRVLKLGDIRIMMLNRAAVPGKKGESVAIDATPFTMIARYEIADGKFRIYNLDEKRLIKAINSGELKGEIKIERRRVEYVRVSSPGDDVRKWLAKEGAAAFESNLSLEFRPR